MLRALETYLPDGCTWNVPDGGFYVWLTVPEGVAVLVIPDIQRGEVTSSRASTPDAHSFDYVGHR